jgi:hypothetical protein
MHVRDMDVERKSQSRHPFDAEPRDDRQDHNLWFEAGGQSTRFWVDGQVAFFSMALDGTVVVAGLDGNYRDEALGWQTNERVSMNNIIAPQVQNVMRAIRSESSLFSAEGTDPDPVQKDLWERFNAFLKDRDPAMLFTGLKWGAETALGYCVVAALIGTISGAAAASAFGSGFFLGVLFVVLF